MIRDKRFGFPGFFRNFNSWKSSANYILRYEDLRNDPYNEFTRLTKFLKIQGDSTKINEAINLSNITSMQIAQKNSEIFKKNFRKGYLFARSGNVGDWKNFFSDEDCYYWEKISEANNFNIYN